jgi:hypothetical protein
MVLIFTTMIRDANCSIADIGDVKGIANVQKGMNVAKCGAHVIVSN